ncbi:MAG: potassium channel family protein, partial [Candidatus Aenigmatarchaeota archaeon]
MRTSVKVMILLLTLGVIMIIGTVTYHNIEGWNYLDSFYFTGMTITTVGYGDFSPITDIGKIFTVFFAFAGVGIALFIVTSMAESYFAKQQKKIGTKFEERMSRYARTHRDGVSRIRRGILSGKIGRIPLSRKKT